MATQSYKVGLYSTNYPECCALILVADLSFPFVFQYTRCLTRMQGFLSKHGLGHHAHAFEDFGVETLDELCDQALIT